MRKSLLSLSLSFALLGTAVAAEGPAKPELGSFGIDLGNRDLKAAPGDDFNRYANGTWQDAYQLKDYESRYGSFNTLNDRAEEQVRDIIQDIAARKDLAPGSDEQKVRDLYASYMDQAARDARGIAAIQPVLDSIAAIDDKAALVTAFGESDVTGTNAPVGVGIDLDRKDPDAYLVSVGVGGLGLPDKDYYTNPDARFVAIRKAYVDNIETLLGFAGAKDAHARASRPGWTRWASSTTVTARCPTPASTAS